MAEGMTPHHYDRQVQEAEAYNLKMQNLEKQGANQHHIDEKPLSTVRKILIAVLAIVLVAAALGAIAGVCTYFTP